MLPSPLTANRPSPHVATSIVGFVTDALSVLSFSNVYARLMILPGSRVGFIDPAILWPMRSAFRDPCASSRHPSQCGGRCERAGRGCRRPAWDRRSIRASARPAVARSGSWSEPGSDPRRSLTSRTGAGKPKRKRSLAMCRRNRLQSGSAANCVRNQGRPCNPPRRD